jgi:hypothetical protein
MTIFRLDRHADLPLIFDGELIADVSTQEDGKRRRRWQEVRVYRTPGAVTSRWVVELTGCSRVRDEVPLIWAVRCATPQAVRLALTTKDKRPGREGRTYMSDACYQALDEAAAADPELQGALAEYV